MQAEPGDGGGKEGGKEKRHSPLHSLCSSRDSQIRRPNSVDVNILDHCVVRF